MVDGWKSREAEKESLITQLKEQSEKMSRMNGVLEEVRMGLRFDYVVPDWYW